MVLLKVQKNITTAPTPTAPRPHHAADEETSPGCLGKVPEAGSGPGLGLNPELFHSGAGTLPPCILGTCLLPGNWWDDSSHIP